MNNIELEKLKIKILTEYRIKNDNRAKEYFFTLDPDSAAKFDFLLELGKVKPGDIVMMLAANNFDMSIYEYAKRNNLCDCSSFDMPSLNDLIRKFMKSVEENNDSN